MQEFAAGKLHGALQDFTEPKCSRRCSLCLDVGCPDNLAPLFSFCGNELSEICWGARKHRAANVGKPRFHPGVNETTANFLVEFVDDPGGSVPGRTDAIPLAR